MTPTARLRRGLGLVVLVLATGAGCAPSSPPRSSVGPRVATPGYSPTMAPAPHPPGPRHAVAPRPPALPLALPDLAHLGTLLPGLPQTTTPTPTQTTPRKAPITPYNPEPAPNAALIAATDPRVAMARAYARDHAIRLDVWHERFTGNTEGYGSPVAGLADGGAVLVGSRSRQDGLNGSSVLVRLDAAGRVQWERSLDGSYPTTEGRTLRVTNGGFLVHVASFLHPGRAPFHRFVQVEANGSIRWERRLRGDGGPNTPHPQVMQENLRGTYDLKGHIYKPGAPETAWAWDGELDRHGHLLRDETRNFDPYDLPPPPADPGIWD